MNTSLNSKFSTVFKRLLESRYRISTQLYLAIGGAVVLTIAASLVGWFSFNRVGDAQSRVNEESIPEIAASFGVAQYSGVLVAAAPRLTGAATTEEFDRVAAEIEEAYTAFEEQLAVLEQMGAGGGSFERIRAHADSLIFNIEAIEGDMSEIFELADRREALRTELEELRDDLDGIMVPEIDNQYFYTITGYRKLGESPDLPSDHFSEDQVAHYRRLAEVQADSNIATQLLASAFNIPDAPSLEPLKESFEAAAGRIQLNLAALEESDLRDQVTPLFDRLFELGIGEENGFTLLARDLALAEHQRDLLALNRGIALDLVGEVDGLVGAARVGAQEATSASTQAILAGRGLLLAISAISIGGALLIAWLYVGRSLLRRLQMLSDWMRRMAGGDLEARVEMAGRDEVADMAAALEVFRRHALEVQRLNLVEELAKELQGKNDELESVLAELQRAQDQIVMREKLAALGQLTAGVAHEIRNPLNFVKNFSESSEELLTELKEVLDEGGSSLNDDQMGLIQDISQDLTDNMERIRSHGERANRIVQDMLRMGRDTGDYQLTDINTLLEEHVRLAYHSARALDSDFQLDMQHDFDPEVGEIEVIPQDLGRVFLNMVGNACDATDEKRRTLAEAENGAEPYTPTLWVATHREGDQVEVRIRDNGKGIPPEIIEKIFNPFFTTKPTGRGTGLGLAMSSDIVRQHGGTIRVDSEPGSFTEMIIGLPLTRPSRVLGDAIETEDADEYEDEEAEEGLEEALQGAEADGAESA